MKVKRLHPNAKIPTVAHPGEDLGFDLYALEDLYVFPSLFPIKVRTGVSVEMSGYGFIIKDRSSLACAGVFTHAGVIDSGYRGEIVVLMSSTTYHKVRAGDKIAQLVPIMPETGIRVTEVSELSGSKRGEGGFGSTGN